MTITSLCYRGNCSDRIRRKTAVPEAIFFVYLFYLFPISPFTMNVTQALPLEAIKGEVGATSKRTLLERMKRTHLAKRPHTPLTKET
jgi:hypothetical protein